MNASSPMRWLVVAAALSLGACANSSAVGDGGDGSGEDAGGDVQIDVDDDTSGGDDADAGEDADAGVRAHGASAAGVPASTSRSEPS